MRTTNRELVLAFTAMLAISLLISCRNVSKKAAKETLEAITEQSGKIVKDSGEKTLKEIGEKGIREYPIEIVMRAMEKDNPIMAKSLKQLSKPFKSALAEQLQSDARLYSAIVNNPNLLDNYLSFAGSSKRIKNDPNLFIWYAHSEQRAEANEAENFLNALVLSDEGGNITVISRKDGGQIASISDGIVRIDPPFVTEPIPVNSSLLKQELLPNSLYRMRDAASGAEYRYKVDQFGRITSIKVKNVTPQEVSDYIFEFRPELSLGASGDDVLKRLRDNSINNDIELSVFYTYTDDALEPSYVRIEGGVPEKVNFVENLSAETISSRNLASIARTVTTRIEGNDAIEYMAERYPKAEALIRDLVDYPGTTVDKFVVEILDDGSVRVSHKEWAMSVMEIEGEHIKVKGGSLANSADQSLNQFLNTRMPDTIYEIDDYMTLATDGEARLSETTAVFRKDDIIERSGTRDKFTQKRIVESQNGLNGDEGGHSIQRGLGGPNELANQTPMAWDVNHSVFAAIESAERESVDAGKTVIAHRKYIYEGNSKRPSFIIINDTIDGEPMKVIINGKEYKCPIRVSNTNNPVIEEIIQ